MDLDRFLNFFNWISSAHGVLGDVFSLARQRGGGVGIAFACPNGETGGSVERALARYKIPVWGRRVTGLVDAGNGEKWRGFSFRTEAHRAAWARYIIWRLGCHVIDDPDPRNAVWAAKYTAPPPAWADWPRDEKRPAAVGSSPDRQQPTSPRGRGSVARTLRDLW